MVSFEIFKENTFRVVYCQLEARNFVSVDFVTYTSVVFSENLYNKYLRDPLTMAFYFHLWNCCFYLKLFSFKTYFPVFFSPDRVW